MTDNDKKLTIELMKGLANGSIDLDKAPILKKMIQDYLHRFDHQIKDSVNNLKAKADKYNDALYGVAKDKYGNIADIGNNEIKKLKNLINKNLNQTKINGIVRNNIKGEVDRAIGKSEPVIDHYLASVSDNTKRMDKLADQAKKVSHEVNKAHQEITQTNSKFWYGIFGAFVLGALFSFIAL